MLRILSIAVLCTVLFVYLCCLAASGATFHGLKTIRWKFPFEFDLDYVPIKFIEADSPLPSNRDTKLRVKIDSAPVYAFVGFQSDFGFYGVATSNFGNSHPPVDVQVPRDQTGLFDPWRDNLIEFKTIKLVDGTKLVASKVQPDDSTTVLKEWYPVPNDLVFSIGGYNREFVVSLSSS